MLIIIDINSINKQVLGAVISLDLNMSYVSNMRQVSDIHNIYNNNRLSKCLDKK